LSYRPDMMTELYMFWTKDDLMLEAN